MKEPEKSVSFLSAVIGHFHWAPPGWLSGFLALRKNKPLVFWAGLILILSSTMGGYFLYHYYQSLPGDVMVRAEVKLPLLADADDEKPEPSSLTVSFVYDFSQLKPNQKKPSGKPSAARLDLSGRQVKKGITLTPEISGRWVWENDNKLIFTPERAWPPGQKFTVSFDKSVFSKETKLTSSKLSFITQPMTVKMKDFRFYQDPKNRKIHKVVSTLLFSHPVDRKSLEQHLKMSMRPSGADIKSQPVDFTYTVKYSKNLLKAYVHSTPIKLPGEPNFMHQVLTAGIKSITGGVPSATRLSEQVKIPDLYSFLRVEKIASHIVRNKKSDPEQVFTIQFTDAITSAEIKDKLKIYLLPKYNSHRHKNYWSSPREVNAETLKSSRLIKLDMIPNQKNASVTYSFKYNAPVRRYLYAYIKPGLKSVNNYVRASAYDAIKRTPEYPHELQIQGDGAVLSLTGSRRLSVLSRGIPGYRVEIGRLRQGQINHLISQTSGDIKSPDFNNYNFSMDNITHVFRRTVNLRKKHPSEANYSSLDLSNYLPRDKNQYGLFYIKLTGWDARRNRTLRVSYKQLVLVTDLGVVLKKNQDRSHEVFVQSLQSGKPVSGVTVSVLALNGEKVMSAKTDTDGHAGFPDMRGFVKEREPVAYIVQSGVDTSFIPYNRYSRQIDYSSFNTGGISHPTNGRYGIKAYLFTDRGIYRPGEQVRVAGVVRNARMESITKIPVEIIVRGPRYTQNDKKVISLGEKGIFEYKYKTGLTSDTGNYHVYVYLVRKNNRRGVLLGSRSFKVEAFQPDTLKITSRIENTVKKGWVNNDKLKVDIQLNNLFGAPAQDRKVQARMLIKPTRFYFEKYKKFVFADPYHLQKGSQLTINEKLGERKTDADGKADFLIKLDRFRRGTYNLRLKIKGYDNAGGRSVSTENSVMISPLSTLVGYKTDSNLNYIHQNAKREIQMIAINPVLSSVALTDLHVRHIELESISTLVLSNDNTYHYQTVKKEKLLKQSGYVIDKSGSRLSLPTDIPGDYVMEVTGPQGQVLSRIKYSVIGKGMKNSRMDKRAELSLKLDKKDYKAGDWIEMNIRAPYIGSGLITIESNKVHEFKWFKTTTNSTMQRIQIPNNLEGNAYVNVVFVRDAASPEIFTSPMSYAVQSFQVDRSKRVLNVDLESAPLVRPGKAMTIKYRTDKPARVIVFAVDEGILQVARYKTPDPLGHFMQKRRLSVTTLQMLDLILPDYKLLQHYAAPGGGMMRSRKLIAKNLNPFSRRVDKPAVFWSGILDSDTTARQVSFTVPETFAGSLRLMAVAVSDTSMGVSTRQTLVRGPFVITPNVLTQAAPGDRFKVTVGVSNLIEKSGKDAVINLQINTSKNLKVIGVSESRLTIAEGSEKSIDFMVQALDKPGVANIMFTVQSGNETAKRSVSLSIRPAVQYQTRFQSGGSSKATLKLKLKRKLYSELAEQKISASASPLVLVDGLSSYLKHFPHGCTEQVVSKMFPVIGLLKHPAYNSESDLNRKKFRHLINKLSERQLANGGFSFWPGGTSVADFPSVYVMHFLIESSQTGFTVPGGMLDRGKDYLKIVAARKIRSLEQAHIRAMAIYLLTRMDVVTTNYLVSLQTRLDEKFVKSWRNDLTAVYMAATYQLLKKKDAASRLVGQYKMGRTGPAVMGDFYSIPTQDAQYIYLLGKHFPEQLSRIDTSKIKMLIEPIFNGNYNTISAAYSVLALGVYTEQLPLTIKNEKINISSIDDQGKLTPISIKRTPLISAVITPQVDQLELKADSSFYYLLSQAGFDKEIPVLPVSKGLEVTRGYFDAQGNELITFEPGQEVTVRIKIRALGNRFVSNVAITDLLPGGFEVIRSSVPRTAYDWEADYVDVREDRIVFYGSFGSSVTELNYKVKVTSAGAFNVAPIYARSMYDRSVYAHSVGKIVKVKLSK